MRVGDISVSDGIVCRRIILHEVMVVCILHLFLLSLSPEGWMAPEVKNV